MPKVLLVDDSKTIQKVVGLILKGSTYSLFSAENPDEGEKLALTHLPDIILVDSLDHVPTFKKNPTLAAVKLGLLYGNFKKISPDVIKELNIDGTLAKPFDAQEFLKFLEDLLKSTDKEMQALPDNASSASISQVSDEFKSLFTEEELGNCLDFPIIHEKREIPTPSNRDIPIPRETVEKICKELISPLAEQIIREEIQKILNDKGDR